MDTEECREYTIHMIPWCQREYSKASKRMDRRLREIIESELDVLRHDPWRGSRLKRDLEGMFSIHIDEFSYRIVYEVDHTACKIIIYRIRHRKAAYDKLVRS